MECVSDHTLRSWLAANMRVGWSIFKKHQLLQESTTQFYCARPGTKAFSFRVSLLPSRLIVTGDVGDLILKTDPDPWDLFICASRTVSYWLGKSTFPLPEVFLLKEAYRECAAFEEVKELRRRLVDVEVSECPVRAWEALLKEVAGREDDPPDCAAPTAAVLLRLVALWKAYVLYNQQRLKMGGAPLGREG